MWHDGQEWKLGSTDSALLMGFLLNFMGAREPGLSGSILHLVLCTAEQLARSDARGDASLAAGTLCCLFMSKLCWSQQK